MGEEKRDSDSRESRNWTLDDSILWSDFLGDTYLKQFVCEFF